MAAAPKRVRSAARHSSTTTAAGAAVHALRRLKSHASVAERLEAAAALSQRAAPDTLLALQEASARHKRSAAQTEERLSWGAEWGHLASQAASLQRELTSFMTSLPTTVISDDVVSLHAGLQLECDVMRGRLRARRYAVRRAIAGSETGGSTVQVAQQALDEELDVLWREHLQLEAEAAAAQEECAAAAALAYASLHDHSTSIAEEGEVLPETPVRQEGEGAPRPASFRFAIAHMSESHISAELDKCGAVQCEDVGLKLDQLEAVIALRRGYESDLAMIEAAWLEFCASVRVEADAAYGGWSHDEHLVYLQAFRIGGITSAAGRGGTRTEECARTAVTLLARQAAAWADAHPSEDPPRSWGREHVLTHHAWYSELRKVQREAEARTARWMREHAAALQRAKAAFADAHARSCRDAETRAARMEHARVSDEARARHAAARRRFEIEQQLARQVQAELAEAEAAAEHAQREARIVHAQARKAALAEYHEAQRRVAHKLEAVQRALESIHEEERREELAAGAVRVQHRRELAAADRHARSVALHAEARALEESKQALLERLLASVPYRERLSEIAATADVGRMQAHTVASGIADEMGRAYHDVLHHAGDATARTGHYGVDFSASATTQDADARALALAKLAEYRIQEQGLYARTGYSDKQVRADPRFRLASALRDAGVGGSLAAQAMLRMPPTGRGAVTAQMQAGSGVFPTSSV